MGKREMFGTIWTMMNICLKQQIKIVEERPKQTVNKLVAEAGKAFLELNGQNLQRMLPIASYHPSSFSTRHNTMPVA
jgi:hypothetical protein